MSEQEPVDRIAPTSPPLKPVRRMYDFWLLAALNALAVVAVLGMSCWGISAWRRSLRAHEQCEQQLQQHAELARLATHCRDAVRSTSMDLTGTAHRDLKDDFSSFWLKLNALRVTDLSDLTPQQVESMNRAWQLASTAGRKFEQESLRVVALGVLDPTVTSKSCVDLERAYVQTIDALDELSLHVTAASQELTQGHQAQIKIVRALQWLIGLTGIVLTGTVFYLGRRLMKEIVWLSKQLNRQADEIAERDAELFHQANVIADQASQLRQKTDDFANQETRLQDMADTFASQESKLRAIAEERADQEARLRTIFDTAADGIITMNSSGVIETCNQATLELFGLQKEGLIKKPIFAFLEEVNENIDASGGLYLTLLDINAAIGKKQEYCGTRRDGTKFYVEFAVAEARIDNRRIITGILHDVTERRRFEVELRQASIAAAAATEAKSQFLANMSHEIRTPMTAIIGYADLLLEPGQSSDERTRCVETIRRNADHLLTLINDILDISKIEAGKMTVERIKYAPSQIIGDVASLMRVRALEKKIGFEVNYDSPIPAEITGDPVRTRQVLINLVGNAIKFTKTGQVKIHAWSENLGKDNPTMSFRVVDSGIGMTSEQLSRLFQPFTQADDSTTRQFGGTGLGLTISQRLVEMMGGKITVTSVPGLGSSFEARVPTGCLDGVRILENPAEAQVENNALDQRNASTVRLHARILLAEDGVDNRRLISYHLQKAGATVAHAENGQIALSKALEAIEKGQPFDVVFMDMAMPVMDGYQATSRLRQAGYKQPIVALTAHAMAGDRAKCVSAGCDDYLTKPIDPRKLIEKARHYASWSQEAEAVSTEKPTQPVVTEKVIEDLISGTASKPTTVTEASSENASSNEIEGSEEDVLVSDFADDPDMAEIIQMFLDGLEDRASGLDNAFGSGNLTELASLAHQLKGAAGGYGYPIISRLALDVERLAKSGESNDDLRSTLDRLVLMCRRAIAGASQLAAIPA